MTAGRLLAGRIRHPAGMRTASMAAVSIDGEGPPPGWCTACARDAAPGASAAVAWHTPRAREALSDGRRPMHVGRRARHSRVPPSAWVLLCATCPCCGAHASGVAPSLGVLGAGVRDRAPPWSSGWAVSGVHPLPSVATRLVHVHSVDGEECACQAVTMGRHSHISFVAGGFRASCVEAYRVSSSR